MRASSYRLRLLTQIKELTELKLKDKLIVYLGLLSGSGYTSYNKRPLDFSRVQFRKGRFVIFSAHWALNITERLEGLDIFTLTVAVLGPLSFQSNWVY
jgi:hypothetical protein